MILELGTGNTYSIFCLYLQHPVNMLLSHHSLRQNAQRQRLANMLSFGINDYRLQI